MMSWEEADRLAGATWQGVYRVAYADQPWFKVVLHVPDGPVHWINRETGEVF